MPKFTLLWTDAFILGLAVALCVYAIHVARRPNLRRVWSTVAADAPAMCASVILTVFFLVAVLDSIHYRPVIPPQEGEVASETKYSPVVRSVLDDLMGLTRMGSPENTYSAPLSLYQFTKETQWVNGEAQRVYPRLLNAGLGLQNDEQRAEDIQARVLQGLLFGAVAAVLLAVLLTLAHWRASGSIWRAWLSWWRAESGIRWRAIWLTWLLLCLIAGVGLALAGNYHVLGTDRTGNDVLGLSLKGLRTAWVIGTLTTLAMLPPALLFGISAGYFKGRVDDVIQYVYTTLTSIPGVLLIAACVLMMQVYIDTHPDLFPTMAARADLRLFLLCVILGLTGWAGLCRMLRAETLKLRELEYVQAAKAFGVSHLRIMLRHLLPNLMHIVLITAALEFSGLVLYEAVLSYLGIGVDPATPSFGTMIDAARLEMARDPMIWWSLLAAFTFMLALVLSANLFADAVQRAFDPRARRIRGRSVLRSRKQQVKGAA
ncbi:ABC transporter permease [Pusillimonas sp. CC-YST705]|uniref:ABC transporter permease n=1 Tax=Mesopusillimonas faecipullorum TaxID=2755040 RepID=A0ABS8CDC0_9BURK|nr:ABC transporter permease [Mesopusillimonas faecipullorum]MCB5364030.1 ABC transporter permease [Mesopusillimonas faecipullorum]